MTTTTYAADSTALLIVDPYNDFMSEGGKFYEATKETASSGGLLRHSAQADSSNPSVAYPSHHRASSPLAGR
jgi:nicotinamidase-related amidase